MKIKIFLSLTALICSLSACLRTRSDFGEAQKIQKVTEDQRRAQFELRFDDINRQIRHMHGRIEAVEFALRERSRTQTKSNQQRLENTQEIWARIKLLEQAIEEFETQWKQVQRKAASQPKNVLARAEEHFANQRWKKAALGFKNYRSKHPKGNSYVSATYKIGVCFEKLGEKDNAQLFYKEITDHHSQHRLAKKARYRLKELNGGSL